MHNINFNDGYKRITINNDASRVIEFNPNDIGMIERINTAYEKIKTLKDEIPEIELTTAGEPIDDMKSSAELVSSIGKQINEQIDYIFNSNVSEVAFGKQSPLSLVGGVPLYERFLDAIMPYIEKEVKKENEASRKRINKYVKAVK